MGEPGFVGHSQAGEVAGRELDARIAVEVMGLPVVGFAMARLDETSCWDISQPDDPAARGLLRPVYVTHPHLVAHGPFVSEWDEEGPVPEWFAQDQERAWELFATDVALWGHPRFALAVVADYSTDIAAAWEVVEKMRALGFKVELSADDGSFEHNEACYADFFNGDSNAAWKPGTIIAQAWAPTMPLAICLAALRANKKPESTKEEA